MVQDRERSETLEEEGVTTEDPTNVTKGQSYRLRVTVPASDESTIAWLEAQHDKLASVCLAIHEAIARHGFVDLVHGPVEPGSEQVVTESQPMAFTIANARMVYEAIRTDERRRDEERSAEVRRMMARAGALGPHPDRNGGFVPDEWHFPNHGSGSHRFSDSGDTGIVEARIRHGVDVSGAGDSPVTNKNATVDADDNSGNTDENTNSDSGDQNTQYDIDDIMSQFRRD